MEGKQNGHAHNCLPSPHFTDEDTEAQEGAAQLER